MKFEYILSKMHKILFNVNHEPIKDFLSFFVNIFKLKKERKSLMGS